MGGQQFLTHSNLLDMRSMREMLSLDEKKSTATFQTIYSCLCTHVQMIGIPSRLISARMGEID